jgi:4-hydroxybenzoate polyprenyltransferase
MEELFYHLKTLWLFTLRDVPAMVIPQTIFGILIALSGNVTMAIESPSYSSVFRRLPNVVFWNWMNVLLFSLANQRLPEAILEDKINKPWRPLPAKRITPLQARRVLLCVIPTVFTVSLKMGSLYEALFLMVGTWMYNDLGGADESFLVRNFMNALGFMCYSSASMGLATGLTYDYFKYDTKVWLVLVGLSIFTTIQVMDLADMEGDASRNRKTLPLLYGEGAARWSIVVFALFWSILFPYCWQVGKAGYALSISSGCFLSARVLFFRGVAQDKTNFVVWSLWNVSLYFLPVLKRLCQ